MSRSIQRLSDAEVRGAKVPPGKKETDLRDGGNLVLRVRPTEKYWRFEFSAGDKKTERIPIGPYPYVSLVDAREIAKGYRTQLALGKNPKIVLAEEEAKKHATSLANEHGEAPITLGQLFERWKSDYCAQAHADKGSYIEGIFRRHILLDGMADLRLDLMEPAHMMTIMLRMSKKKLPGTTKRVLDALRQMFKWAVPFKWLHHGDPTFGLTAKAYGGYTNEGTRYLVDDEIVQLHWRLKKSYLVNRWKHCCYLVVATGTRIEETVLAERIHVDFALGTWTIPLANQKKTNREAPPEDHVIFLSDFARRHLEALLDMPGTGQYIFPASGRGEAIRSGPANEKTPTHAVSNLQGVGRDGRRTSTELLLRRGRWTPHDLRRTTASAMRELGVHSDVVDLCLNHVSDNKVKRTYQRSKLEKMTKDAWGKLGAHLEMLTSLPDPEPDYLAPPPLYKIIDMTNPEHRRRKAAEKMKTHDFGDGALI